MILAFLQNVILAGATVHPMTPGSAAAPRDVVIEDGRIVALTAPGETTRVPPDARRVDAAGLHLIPGLIDGFVNHDAEHDRLYVANGVTLVRDLGGDLALATAERAPAARQRNPGPWIWAAGAALGGPGARSGILIATPEELEGKLTRLLADYPIDYLSVQVTLPTPAWRKLLELAHAKDKQVWGPLVRGSSLNEALEAGQDGLFHIDALLPGGKSWSQSSFEELAPRAARLGASKTALVPTLAVHATRLVQPRAEAPELSLLAPLYAQAWKAEAIAREVRYTAEGGLELQRGDLQLFGLMQRLLKEAHDKGVVLVPGSASPSPWLLPGRALVEELVLWGRAGIPPAAVVHAATAGAAARLGVKDRGTIEVGKVADLVAYAGDPTAELGELRNPRLVVLRGQVLLREELDRLVEDLRARQLAQQKRVLGSEALPLGSLEDPQGTVLLRGEAEHRVTGLRLSAERYQVERLADGALRYRTRLLTLGGIALADTELDLDQTVRDGRLAEFTLEVRTGPRVITVRGVTAGGVLNVERRVDGGFVSNQPVREKLLFVDVASVLAPVAVGQHARDGDFKVLFFDDFEPAVGNWTLRIDEQQKLLVRTHTGFFSAVVDAEGRPTALQRDRAQGVDQAVWRSSEALEGGLPVPAENRKASAKLGAPPTEPR